MIIGCSVCGVQVKLRDKDSGSAAVWQLQLGPVEPLPESPAAGLHRWKVVWNVGGGHIADAINKQETLQDGQSVGAAEGSLWAIPCL